MSRPIPAVDPEAGRAPGPGELADIPRLLTAYYVERPDPAVPEERVSFGTSGHRGSPLNRTFNERHILAITQAICLFRRRKGIDGPLFLGIDTHALSRPAFASALEVLAANDVCVMIAENEGYTPTPVISRAIIAWNRRGGGGRADGIVITPSHNPPEDGGLKYNPPHGGPASTEVTRWIEDRANAILAGNGIKRTPYERALRSPATRRHDYVTRYIADLAAVLDLDAVRAAGLHLAVDALGGAGIGYWARISERYGLDLTVLDDTADPTFRFMRRDWDGRIRMDPSSPYAMQGLVGLKGEYDLAFACDTDHDRHGIVTRGAGLMPPNQYLAVMADHLLTHRPEWKREAAIAKTVVSSGIIDRVAARRGGRVYETPVGFKWFVEGLSTGALAFAGEESAGASFLEKGGHVWTTDKDGIAAALLSAEITALAGRDPAELYAGITAELGMSFYRRSDGPADAAARNALAALTPRSFARTELGGEKIEQVLTRAPGDGAPIGGIKVVTAGGWFAVRPSGTEDVCKIYCESFRSATHLDQVEEEARMFVAEVTAQQGEHR